jgi:hypothetical protein
MIQSPSLIHGKLLPDFLVGIQALRKRGFLYCNNPIPTASYLIYYTHMSTIKHTIILLILLTLLGLAYIFKDSIAPGLPTQPVEDDVVMCTMDAMMCPDGTYVGRSGPNCQFVCPVVTNASSTSLYEGFTVGLNESKKIGNTTIKAWAVTQDSRCPMDALCIQAGKVTVAFDISDPAGDSTKELTIGDTIETSSLIFTLKEVQPYPISTKKTQDGEYRFVMDVKGK